jgi:transposase
MPCRRRRRTVDVRLIVDAVLRLARTGCWWRNIPHESPPRGTVRYYYRRWRLDGTWHEVRGALLGERVGAEKEGREATPSVAIIDSRSVTKTAGKGAPRLRRGQADNGAQAPYRGGHLGIGPRGDGPRGGEQPGSRRGEELVPERPVGRSPR